MKKIWINYKEVFFSVLGVMIFIIIVCGGTFFSTTSREERLLVYSKFTSSTYTNIVRSRDYEDEFDGRWTRHYYTKYTVTLIKKGKSFSVEIKGNDKREIDKAFIELENKIKKEFLEDEIQKTIEDRLTTEF